MIPHQEIKKNYEQFKIYYQEYLDKYLDFRVKLDQKILKVVRKIKYDILHFKKNNFITLEELNRNVKKKTQKK